MAEKSIRDIAWVAGLLEGEGCFSGGPKNHNPRIQLIMTDPDVVVSAAKIMGAHRVVRCKQDTRANKPIFRMVVYGSRAMGWMMTLWPLMGSRRREKIEECISVWKNKNRKQYKERRSYSRGAPIIWQRDNSAEVCLVR